MKVIVGLGNPGVEYERTRHNAGFMALDRLADRHAPGGVARGRFHALTLDADIRGERCLLMKPTTYMNRSGLSVGEAVRFYKLDPVEDLLVIVDDVAIPVGAIRVRARGSAGGHNGLDDIQRALGDDNYARVRVGIDAPGMARQRDYVLGRFSPEQLDLVQPALDKAADAAACWATEGVTSAMNTFNVRPPKPANAEQPQDASASSESNNDSPDGRDDPEKD